MKPHAALSLKLDNSWSFCESFRELNIIDPAARIKIICIPAVQILTELLLSLSSSANLSAH